MKWTAIAGIGLATAGVAAGAQPPTFKLIEISPADGSAQMRINSAGQVTGALGGPGYAAYWDPVVGQVDIAIPPGATGVRTDAVLADGTVVGTAWISGCGHPFIFSGGTYGFLPLPPGVVQAQVTSANSAGLIVGIAAPGDDLWDDSLGIAWIDGEATVIADDEVVHAYPYDVSEEGTVVGTCLLPTPQYAPFHWSEGALTILDQGQAVYGAAAVACSDNGIIGGAVDVDPTLGTEEVPAIWQDGTWTLVPLPSGAQEGYVRGVNSFGHAVGHFQGEPKPGEFISGRFYFDGTDTWVIEELMPFPMSPADEVWDISNDSWIILGFDGYSDPALIIDMSPSCAADLAPIGGDSLVNVDDLLLFVQEWGGCWAACPGDVDGDHMVDVADLLALLDAWGPCE